MLSGVSRPLNWSRNGAIAIDARKLFRSTTVRGQKLNLKSFVQQ